MIVISEVIIFQTFMTLTNCARLRRR